MLLLPCRFIIIGQFSNARASTADVRIIEGPLGGPCEEQKLRSGILGAKSEQIQRKTNPLQRLQ